MLNRQRQIIRGVLLIIIFSSVLVVSGRYITANKGAESLAIRQQAELPEAKRSPIAPPRNEMTVITTQRRQHVNRGPGYIVAIGKNGRVKYYNETYHSYWDVDPVAGTTATVMYVASQEADSACPTVDCWNNVVERVNLTTGKTVRLYERIVPARGSTRWHDVDAINDTQLLVADMAEDRVFLVDVRNGVTEWSWDVASAFPPTAGGSYPDDWTHLNDVELLPDGRVMVSLRNMDQVVFLDPQSDLQEDGTLGQDDNYSILFEQHNPDYIPESEGGPAVLVSDSENNRLVEYQRKSGVWRKSWRWTDARLQWPRDADRLPSGRTLVTDTHGGRVLEVAPTGTVVWQVEIIAPYEAERLGSGDESTGGLSAEQARLTSRRAQNGDNGSNPLVNAFITLSDLLPNVIVNGLLWVVPPWMRARDIVAAGIGIAGLISLGFVEVYWRYKVWSPFTVAICSPIDISWRDRE